MHVSVIVLIFDHIFVHIVQKKVTKIQKEGKIGRYACSDVNILVAKKGNNYIHTDSKLCQHFG